VVSGSVAGDGNTIVQASTLDHVTIGNDNEIANSWLEANSTLGSGNVVTSSSAVVGGSRVGNKNELSDQSAVSAGSVVRDRNSIQTGALITDSQVGSNNTIIQTSLVSATVGSSNYISAATFGMGYLPCALPCGD
jgi:carbonic anhydrase/acetyltransferase-like protein (isoleucine patch superfamily)